MRHRLRGLRRPTRDHRRWVSAPPDSDPSGGNRVVGVWLAPGERVRWEWTAHPRTRPYVCGYTIEQPWRASPHLEDRACGFRVDG